MKTFSLAFASLVVVLSAACGDTAGVPITNAAPDPDGGSAGGDGAVASDGGGGGDGATPDGGAPQDPVLVVGTSSGLLVWRDAKSLAMDTAPDATIMPPTGSADVLAVASIGDRLYASNGVPGSPVPSSMLLRYEGARALTSASTPSLVKDMSATVTRLVAGPGDRVFAIEQLGGVQMWAAASTLNAGSTRAAIFVHPFSQLAGAAYDGAGDRLFAGQISGAGTLGWNAASTKSGASTKDFDVANGAYWAMQIAGDRLYAVGTHADGSQGVAIWSGVSGISGAVSPIELKTGYAPGKFISHVVVKDDVLIVAARDEGAVRIYTKASALAADVAPTFTLTHASMAKPSRVALDAKGRLYVADQNRVLVWRDVASSPAFVTSLTTGVGAPADVLVLE